jgi:hypothetical protein
MRNGRDRAQVISQLQHEVAEPLADLIARAERAVTAEMRAPARLFTQEEHDKFDILMSRLDELDARIQAHTRAVETGAADGSFTARLRDERLAVRTKARELIEAVSG